MAEWRFRINIASEQDDVLRTYLVEFLSEEAVLGDAEREVVEEQWFRLYVDWFAIQLFPEYAAVPTPSRHQEAHSALH